MKWINHQIVTGFIVFAATDNALSVASSIVGAVIPDRVEGDPPKESKAYWEWRKHHRTWSHYPVIYFALLAALLFAKDLIIIQNPMIEPLFDVGMYVLIGALLHIAEDAICGKVPLFTPTTKYGIKLFTVGSFKEYLFSIIIIAICLFSRFGDFDQLKEFIITSVQKFI